MARHAVSSPRSATSRRRWALLVACVLAPFALVAFAGDVLADAGPAGATGVRVADFAPPAGCALDTDARQRLQREIDVSDGIAAGDASQVAAVRDHLRIYIQTWIRDYCAQHENEAPNAAAPGGGAAGATGVRVADFALPAGCALDTDARQRLQREIDVSDGIAAGDASQVAAVRDHLRIYIQTWIRDYCAGHAE